MKRQSQQGIALVITLILLSVITFMTVTFLVISGRERDQVDTTTQQNVAKFAADGMEQQAAAQIVALMLGQANGYNFGLLVSTNFVTPGGYNPVNGGSLYNVNYYYDPTHGGGGPLSSVDELAMLTNLLFLPRAPVFVTTNKNAPPDFRFYNDLNGNGIYDTNGPVAETPPSGPPVTNYYTGDPEWIGFLEHPDQRHSPSNFFLGRGAFIALPIGNSLDVNYLHNQAKFLDGLNPALSINEGFFRNEGIGSWEINLAAFLQTLNINIWGAQLGPVYIYSTNPTAYSQGTAFSDAASIMQYRYNSNYNVLSAFQNLYGGNAFNSYLFNSGIDAFTVGPLMTGLNIPGFVASSYSTSPWSGADNPALIFGPRDLLTTIPSMSSNTPLVSFTNHLYQAGIMFNLNQPPTPPSITNSYNRYTFYRMLAQMGVGSAPEPAPYPIGGGSQVTFSGLLPMPIPANTQIGAVASTGAAGPGGRNQMSFGTVPEAYPYPHGRKMNLNYNNLATNNLAGQSVPLTVTNYVPWTPAQFFTNAADRMLRTYFPTNFAVMINGNTVVTNLNINFIPIYPVNYYTPSVHRMLQLAANMYDASTNKISSGFDYPSVFRPIFNKSGHGANSFVYITGYYEVSNNLTAYQNKPLDLKRVIGTTYDVDTLQPLDSLNNVYGIPYVIGARTNLPNFNQFSMAPVVQMSRGMQINRTSPSAPMSAWWTNISYQIGLSNVMGVQCWNSYTNYFGYPNAPRPVNIYVANDFSVLVTNNFGAAPALYSLTQPISTSTTLPVWAGYVANSVFATNSFQIPFTSNAVILPNEYVQLSPPLYGPSNNPPYWNPVTYNASARTYFQPDWGVMITNRVRVIMTDVNTGRIIDYVQLGGLGQLKGLDSQDDVATNLSSLNFPGGVAGNFWNTSAEGTNASGVYNATPVGFFVQYQISLGTGSAGSAWASVPSGSLQGGSVSNAIAGFNLWVKGLNNTSPVQVPFTPTTAYAKVYTWSANDPLVHYMVGDLTDLTQSSSNRPTMLTNGVTTNVLSQLTKVSSRYRPWGNTQGLVSPLNNITSDYLEYIDPQITQSSDWQLTGNKYPNVGWLGRVHRGTPWQTVYLKAHSQAFTNTAWQYWTGNPDPNDAANTQPINDWRLLDLFTAAPNDNASRGQLSVNQTNAAAWAAVLDGVMVFSNSANGLVPVSIDTTQTGGLGQTIIAGINQQRINSGGVFTSVGQILATPQLMTNSPYISINNSNANLTDAVYERIPQQIMGLLRVGTPRYAIYSYGQALKPANNSIVQSGAFFGLCTNYQITGEALTRTIVRFDNMPVPGQALPGTTNVYALPVQGSTPPSYVMVTNILPPVRAVVESYSILGPDQ